MSKFKPGDKVVVIDGPQKGEKVRTLKNRVDSVFFTNFPVRIKNQHYDAKGIWYAGAKVYLRHATAKEISAMQEPKRLRWGDLVVCNGEIHMVFDDHPDDYGDYRVLCLTRDCRYSYMPAKELIKVGSIRKKIKRLHEQKEGAK